MIAERERWSDTVEDYYPVEPTPRWGHGKLPNAHIKRVLDSGRSGYEASLWQIGASRDLFHAVHRTSSDALQPSWNNHWFSVLDAASLMGFLIARRPKRYLEIGSGHSTLFARFSIQASSLPTLITSIDPQPRHGIDKVCDTAIRLPLERCDLTVFGSLEEGDVLFFDGSHRAFTNSDVVAFIFDILPMLRPGILVHFHDIFWPDDYPPAWNGRLYSEQYVLGAMLLCKSPPFRLVLPNYYVCTDPDLSGIVRRYVCIAQHWAGHTVLLLR
jgi:Methyltransferase domain